MEVKVGCLQSTASKAPTTSGSGVKRPSSGTGLQEKEKVGRKAPRTSKGKKKCEGQTKQLADYLKYQKEQGKGKKGKSEGKSQANGSRGSEEPEVVVVDDGDEEPEGASFQ